MSRILVVDDDASILETFRGHLQDQGHTITTAGSAEEALNRLSASEPDLVITDVRMAGMSGLDLLVRIKAAYPDLPVLVITAHEDMRSAIDAMKAGAHDYLVKPLDLDHIDMVIARSLRDVGVARRARQLSDAAAEPYGLDRLVGRDPQMIAIYKLVGQLSRTATPVLIRGETGTGKELIARAIHYNSERAAEPFVAVNCTALPESLLESELFGHVRGAFTGASADHRGHFERAHGGTIFLDEIGDTSGSFQSKLLRVLQEGEFFAVGAERARRTDARVVAATHRPLEELVSAGKFREDLYFRLRVVEIRVPPLRERRRDIPLLAEHIALRYARAMHRAVPLIPPTVMRALELYDWPGNVRELENAISRALVLAPGSSLSAEHLGLDGAIAARGAQTPADTSLAAAELVHVRAVLAAAGGNKREAARRLGISRARLDRILSRTDSLVTE